MNENNVKLLCESLKEQRYMLDENKHNLMDGVAGYMKKDNEQVLKKPKNPPIWGEELFERYAGKVKYWKYE